MTHDVSRIVASCLMCACALAACRSSRDQPDTSAANTGEPAAARPAAAEAAPAGPRAVAGQAVDPPAAPGAMGVNLLAAGDELLASWIEPATRPDAAQAKDAVAAEERTPLEVRMARLGGATWSPAVSVASGPEILGNWADFPALALGPENQLVAYFLELRDPKTFAYDLAIAASSDGGQHFTRLGTAHADATPGEHGFVSSVRHGDAVRAFWLDGRAQGAGHGHGHGAMSLRTTEIRGQGIALDSAVDERVCDCCGTAAAMTDDGPLVVYRNRSEDEVRDIWYAVLKKDGWTRPAPVHLDGWKIEGCPVNGPRVVARGRQVAVAWYTYADDVARVRVAFSLDAGQHFAAPVDVDVASDERAPLGRVDIALADAGDPDAMEVIITWMASRRERALVLARRVRSDGLVGEPVALVDTLATRSAGFPRVARLGGDLLLGWVEAVDADAQKGQAASTAVRVTRFAARQIPAVAERTGSVQSDLAQAGAQGSGPNHALPRVGQTMPGYAAKRLDGSAVSLADERGHPVLLNVWATWCEPCRHELPELAALHAAYQERGLRVIGVSVDQMRSPAEIREFAERREVAYELWHDPEDSASHALGVAILPASILIGRDGTVRFVKSGAISADDPALQAALEAEFPAAP